MAITTRTNKYIFIIISFIFLLLAGTINTYISPPPIQITKQQSALNVNYKFLKIFSMGQARMISDFLWISTLLESDLDHYKQKNLESWMFLRFKSIITLDPKFKRAYQFGGSYLSIVKDDLIGARYIFERGLEIYPADYRLLHNYGFLLAFEIGDFKAAVPVYEKLITYPKAPEFYRTLLLKLKYEDSQDLELTFKAIYDIYKDEPADTHLKRRLTNDLYSIKAMIDLKCLNAGKANCARKDFKGYPYNFLNGKYSAKFDFQPYRLKKRK